MSNFASGLSIDGLIGPMVWMVIVGVLCLMADALGRRKGEPEAPVQPDLHNQVETMMRLKPGHNTSVGSKRL